MINAFLTLFPLGMSLSTSSSFSLNGIWEEMRRGRSSSHKTSNQVMPQFSLPPPVRMRHCLSSAIHEQTLDRFVLTGTKSTPHSHRTTVSI